MLPNMFSLKDLHKVNIIIVEKCLHLRFHFHSQDLL